MNEGEVGDNSDFIMPRYSITALLHTSLQVQSPVAV